MNDTPPAIHQKMVARIKQLSGEDRLKMGASMFDMAKSLMIASLGRSEEKELRCSVFLRFYGSDFDKKRRARIINFLNR